MTTSRAWYQTTMVMLVAIQVDTNIVNDNDLYSLRVWRPTLPQLWGPSRDSGHHRRKEEL